MPEKDGYEIIKFVERGSVCYRSTDYAEGVTLYHWVKYHKKIEKDKLYGWFCDLINQLVMFQKQKGNPYYNLLNPYHIVVTRQNKLFLMDTESIDSHIEYPLDKYFAPLSVHQNVDIYCFGKIIQFIMAHIQCEPCLTKKEEHKLLKIVKKCLETRPQYLYKNIQTIQNDFMKNKKQSFSIPFPHIQIQKKVIIGISVFLLLIAVGFYMIRERQISGEESIQTGEILETPTTEKIQEENLYMDVGVLYFLEYENYEKSIEYFKKAVDDEIKAGYYIELAEYMLENLQGKAVEIPLELLKKEVIQEEQRDIKEVLLLQRVYALLDTEEAYSAMYELGTLKIAEEDWERLPEQFKMEFIQFRALACEKLEMWDEAIGFYEKLCEMEKEREETEELYLSKISLLEEQEKKTKGENIWLEDKHQ